MISFPLFFSTQYNQIKKFFKKVPTQNETFEQIKFEPVESYSYIDPNLSAQEKIELEKRRRYQVYQSLDYLLSVVSYFDFFSLDSFQIAKKSKELSQVFQKQIITSDLLLLPFFEYNPQIKILLEKYGVHEQLVGEIISTTNKLPNENLQVKTGTILKNLLIRIDIPVISEMLILPKETKYSYEIHKIFEKAAENAVLRFKTPVISSEILLITMLEAKKSKVGKLLKQLLKTETNWYMLRYCLMKRLHNQELSIRTDVPKNQQYFAYLLKTQLQEIEFDMLIEKDCLLPGILLFRNNMVADILQVDIYEHLKVDILASIKSRTKKRTYASLKGGGTKRIKDDQITETEKTINKEVRNSLRSSLLVLEEEEFANYSLPKKTDFVSEKIQFAEQQQKTVNSFTNPKLRNRVISGISNIFKKK